MDRLVKRPTPRNFRNKTVSLSFREAHTVEPGTKLVILKYEDASEVFAVVTVTDEMIATIEDYGRFFTMRWSV